jgi:suppressor for copper-sensitivity B
MKQFIFWRIVLALWFFIFLISPTDCRPQGSLQESGNVHISLLSESKTVGQDKKVWFGLRAEMAPGWKTYWRTPGVAGYGVRLNWEKSENIKSAQILWPLPRRFQTEFETVNGYSEDIVLPISVGVIDISKPVHAIVQVDILVCDKSLCVPVRKILSLDLPVGSRQENKAEVSQIRKFPTVWHSFLCRLWMP